MGLKVRFLLWVMLFFPCQLWAQEDALGIKEIYQLAVANDASLGAVAANSSARLQQLPQARSSLLPTLTLTANWDESDREIRGSNTVQKSEINGWRASLQQTLFDASAWFQYRGALAQSRQVKADLAAAQQNLLVRVLEAYLDILRADEGLRFAEAEERAVERQLEQVRQRFEVGLSTLVDVLNATATLDNVRVQVVQARGDWSGAFEALYQITGRGFSAVGSLSDALPIQYPEPQDEDAWAKEAGSRNWSVKAAEALLDAAKQERRASLASHLPTVNFELSRSYSKNNNGFIFAGTAPLSARETDTDALSLNLRLPILQGGRTFYRHKETRLWVEAAEWSLEEARRSAERNARMLYQSTLTGVRRVEALSKSIASGKSSLEATRTGYEAGIRTILDILQAERNLSRTMFDYASARYQHILNVLRLKEVSGTLNPEDFLGLDQFVMLSRPVDRERTDSSTGSL